MPPCIPASLHRAAGNLFNLFESTRGGWDRAATLVLCWRLEYTTGHSAAFVLQRWSQGYTWFYQKPEKHHSWLPICSQTLCFHEGGKVGNTQRKEVSWSWLGKAIAANHVIWCLISHFSTRPHWWKHFSVTIRTEIAFVCLVCKHHLYFL